jgi:hypothetical protein
LIFCARRTSENKRKCKKNKRGERFKKKSTDGRERMKERERLVVREVGGKGKETANKK